MAPDGTVSGYWHEHGFRLRFQVSDLTLGSVELPVLAHACSLDEIKAGTQPEIPRDPPKAYRGYLVRSSPGTVSRATIHRHARYIGYTFSSYERCYVDLQGTFASYQAKFSSKTRNTISRKVRKFEQASDGALRFICYTTPAELLAFHAQARQVSAKTYQERLLDAGLPGDAIFIENMQQEAARNAVRAFMLFLGERPVAYLYCPVERDTVIYAYLGFDPALSELSPGTVLLWLALQRLFGESRFTHFDFTEGDSAQKRLFSTGSIRCHNTVYLRHSIGIDILVRAHLALDAMSRRAGDVLERVGIKKKLKRLLRGRFFA